MKTNASKSNIGRGIDLSRLLNPSSIAIIGASSNPKAISGLPLRFMLDRGYQGKIYPVNSKREEVQGLRTFPDVLSVPRPCDVALVAVSAPQVPRTIEQCGEAGIPFAVVLAGGFEEIGERGRELQRELDAAIEKSGVRVVGPNCVGVANIATRAFCAFGWFLWDPALRPGPVAVVSQSGGIGMAIIANAHAHGVGSNYFVSCGNEADLGFFDFVHHLLGQDDVKAIAVYLEGSTEGIRLRELGRRALELDKPILMLKVGNEGAARRAASSHTGKLTADYTLFQTAFREGGYIELNDLDELVNVGKLVLGGKFPKGRNIGIITGSGGWGVMMAEQCEKYGLQLPLPSPTTVEKLRELVPSYGSRGNPIDMTPDRYQDQHKAMQCLIDDPVIDQLLVRSAQGLDSSVWASRFVETATMADKPVIVNWVQIPSRDMNVKEMIEKSGFVCASYASEAARAANMFTEYALKRQKFRQRDVAALARPMPRQILNLGNSEGALTEHVSKQCLAQYGIPVTREVLLSLDDIQALIECPIAFPVAVKLASPDIPHKTEANAVQLGVKTLDELKRAAEAVTTGGLCHTPSARIDGISVQEMSSGIEMIVGAVNDQHFGPYVMLGLGGILTEVLHDVTHRFAPLTAADAREMLDELKGAKIFEGYRGAPPADVDALVQVLVSVSWLISDYRDQIAEIDINPLFVRAKGSGVVAADALIVTSSAPGE